MSARKIFQLFSGVLLLVVSVGYADATVTDSGVMLVGRRVFRRMEPDAVVRMSVTNMPAQSMSNLNITANVSGQDIPVNVRLNDTGDKTQMLVEIPLNTTLKPGEYEVAVQMIHNGTEHDGVAFSTNINVNISARPLPDIMPVIFSDSWGTNRMDELKAAGFNCFRVVYRGFKRVWRAGEPVPDLAAIVALNMEALDAALLNNMNCFIYINPGYQIRDTKVQDLYQRRDRAGEPYRHANFCGLFSDVQNFFHNVGVSVAMAYGSHPALAGARINNEIRDHTELCFHAHDIEAYRRFAGRDIPPEVVDKSGLGRNLGASLVPSDGIVPDDDPFMDFYRWFWKEGDGWNVLTTKVHNGLKAHGVSDAFYTFHDPAVRVPPLWGSGGEVTHLNQWTYTNPEPLRMGLVTDEVFAMVAGRPGQRVIKLTTTLWYRTRVAPELPEKMEDRADWEKAEPEARFITVAPDHLREAFWLKVSRPVQGIMYYGAGVLLGGGQAQRRTNPDTIKVLTELLHDVVQPLGPTLMQVTEAPSDVAMLESFSTGVFGGQWTWGYSRGWAGWVHLILQWARLQPQVVYEETILRDNLEGIRVLVLPDCRVLPQSVCDKIVAFQRRGGILVADNNLAPALTPDILIPASSPRGAPDRNKAGLQAMAEQLRADLAPVYDWYADSSDPDVIVYRRAYKDTDYLFAINDKREYGDYVGHHRKVMEQGVPCSANLTLHRPGGYVYDLVESRAVAMVAGDEKNNIIQKRHFKGDNGGRLTTGSPSIICSSTQLEGEPVVSRPLPVFEPPRKISWPAELEPGGGRLYMITARPIESVRVEVAERQPDDRRVHVRVAVTDGAGVPVDAVVPVEVRIHDPAGQEAEFSGYYGARDGVQELALDMAANDLRGTWTVKVRELATGKKTETSFEY